VLAQRSTLTMDTTTDLPERARHRLARALDVLYSIAFDTRASHRARRNAVVELLARNFARPPSVAPGTPVLPMSGETRTKLTQMLPSLRRRE
jgi:hypothetical protein